MEWNGMEWNEWNGRNGPEGMEWKHGMDGMEWNGMEWNGINNKWNGMNGMDGPKGGGGGMEWNGMEMLGTHGPGTRISFVSVFNVHSPDKMANATIQHIHLIPVTHQGQECLHAHPDGGRHRHTCATRPEKTRSSAMAWRPMLNKRTINQKKVNIDSCNADKPKLFTNHSNKKSVWASRASNATSRVEPRLRQKNLTTTKGNQRVRQLMGLAQRVLFVHGSR